MSIVVFKQNDDIDKYTFYWSSQIIGLHKDYNCLNVRIIECISSVASDRYEGDYNCQSFWYLLTGVSIFIISLYNKAYINKIL